jgi:predicted MarR family transcription regulator
MATREQFNFLVNDAQPTATGALDALEVPERVCSTATIQLAGTFTATITWQGTVDGTNYASVRAVLLTDGTESATASAAGIYRIDTTGLKKVRPNITAFTSSVSMVCTGSIVEG